MTTTTPITIRIAGSINASAAVSAVTNIFLEELSNRVEHRRKRSRLFAHRNHLAARSGKIFACPSDSARLLPSRTVEIDATTALKPAVKRLIAPPSPEREPAAARP